MRLGGAAATHVIPILVFAALLNAFTFALFGLDKKRAAGAGRRVPEARLLASSALGGALGGWLAMSVLRHKTRKTSFRAKMTGATLICAGIYYALARLLLQTPAGGG